MSAVSPVAPYAPTNFTTQTATAYKTGIDNNSAAAQRIAARFAPHAAAAPNMTVLIDPGSIFSGITLTEIAQQTTPAFTAPVNYPRIDRVVIDNVSGALQVVPGTENTSPTPPAIPNGKSPVAQVLLTVGMSTITNAAITDERNFGALATGGFAAQASIGSAATCDLGAVLSRNALVTGTTTISSFGASANTQSPIYLLEFAASLTLTNGGALLLPGNANIATAAGDTAMAEYLGGGNWRIRSYHRADGSSIDVFNPDNGSAAGTQGLVPAPPVGAAAGHYVLSANGWAASSLAVFNSGPEPIGAGTLLTLQHGLGVVPTQFTTLLQNVTPEGGYANGDTVLVGPNQNIIGGSSVSRGHAIWADSTNVYVRFGSYNPTTYDLLNKNTGQGFDATNSKWNFVLYARP